MITGTIFDVQRFSVHDGPGIRTTVFLKGCPLRCLWCQNPEGLERGIRVWNFDNLCVGCGRCIASCRSRALRPGTAGRPVIDHGACTRCGACVDVCNWNAMALDGREASSGDLVRQLLDDRVFFAVSGGGVTFSGGEPTAQADFVREVAAGLKEEGVNTAIETSLDADWEAVAKIVPVIDHFQVDVKLADAGRHRAATGRDNGVILANLRRLAGQAPPERILVRIPLIPGYTADADNLRGIVERVAGINPDLKIELLNFNPLAAAKYRRMPERHFALAGAKAFSEEEMRRFREGIADLVGTV